MLVFSLSPIFSFPVLICFCCVFSSSFNPIAGIIKCVTLTTMYINGMWWPPNRSVGGMIHQTIFLILSALAAFNYGIVIAIANKRYINAVWHNFSSPKIVFLHLFIYSSDGNDMRARLLAAQMGAQGKYLFKYNLLIQCNYGFWCEMHFVWCWFRFRLNYITK